MRNRVRIVQHQRQLVQRRIAKALGLDRLHGRQHIIAVDAGLAVALQHVAQLIRQRQPSCILYVAAVDDVSQRADPLPRLVLQPHRPLHLAVDRGDLFALAQIGDRGGAVLFRDAERDATAGAAALELEAMHFPYASASSGWPDRASARTILAFKPG